MKWFFAFNQLSEASYGDFVRVAVMSARAKTGLKAYCLYDGQPTNLTSWLEWQGVTIISCRFRFADWWEDLAARKHEPVLARIALGAFLRMELPDVMSREGMDDEFALYTDCDVIFKSDVIPLLDSLRPRYFAVGPEFTPEHNAYINTGVMWMNIIELREENASLMKFAKKHMARAAISAFDQGIYRAYFNPPHRKAWNLNIPDRFSHAQIARRFNKSWLWEELPFTMNWKPYWDDNPEAQIIHFHGLKPTQREALEKGEIPEFLARMRTPFWEKCVAEWDDWLEKANNA